MSRESHLEHFGLREPPFQLAPDPEFLYLSTQHSLAQAYLSYALLNRDSFVVLTGETGTGKTTLINRLVATAGDRVAISRVAHSQLTPVELLQSLLLGFGVRAFDKQKVELLSLLEEYISGQHEARRQVLIVVDDAHNLGVDVLEEIRLVTQLSASRDAAVNLILSGRPALRETLELPVLEQLRQRMRFNFELTPLSAEDTAHYIARRLDVAGADRPLFAPDCIATVVRYTAGIPRLINILCDTALMSAFTEGASEVDEDILRAAIEELDWSPHRAADGAQEELQLSGEIVNKPAFVAEQMPGHAAPRGAARSTSAAEEDDEAVTIGRFSDTRGAVAGAPRGSGEREPAAGLDVPGMGNSQTAGGARAVFTVLEDGHEVARHELTGDRLTIGRERDNDIQIAAEYVSRHHAQVSWLRGGCWIADLNSTNGTFVNGLRVRRRLLRNGDEIQFGRLRLRVSCANPSAEAVAADNDNWRETLVLAEENARKA